MKTGKQRAAEDAAKLEIKQRDTILLSETRESGLPSPNASKLGLKLRVGVRQHFHLLAQLGIRAGARLFQLADLAVDLFE